MNAKMKKMTIVMGLMALAASPALARKGPGGGGKIKGGGSAGCVQYGFSAERVDDPDFEYAGRILLTLADTCDSDKRSGSDIEAGEARFSVLVNGEEACASQSVGFDDLGSLEYECEVRLAAEDLPARLEACVEIDADLREGKQSSALQGSKCHSMDIDRPTSG